jgi:hypothetical protein
LITLTKTGPYCIPDFLIVCHRFADDGRAAKNTAIALGTTSDVPFRETILKQQHFQILICDNLSAFFMAGVFSA